MNGLCEKVAALGIVRDEHGIRGPGVDGGSYYCSGVGEFGGKDVKHWPDELGPKGRAFRAGTHGRLAAEVAKVYRASNDAEQRRRLAEAFLLVADHLQDQGQALDFESVLQMREVLGGQRFRHTSASCSTTSTMAAAPSSSRTISRSSPPWISMGMTFTAPLGLCFSQGRGRTGPVAQCVESAARRSILQPSGGLKIDGSAYHHSGHYHSYAQNAFANFPPVLRNLSGTPWRLCPEAHERLRRAMLAQRFYANRYDLPLSLTGRSPFATRDNCGRIFPWGIKGLETLALLGTPDGKEEVDREVAAAYLHLAPKAADKEPYKSLGIKPEPEPNGTFVLPYAALGPSARRLARLRQGPEQVLLGKRAPGAAQCLRTLPGPGQLGDPGRGKSGQPKGQRVRRGGLGLGPIRGHHRPPSPAQGTRQGLASHQHDYSIPETFVGGLSHQGRQGVFAMVQNQGLAPEGKTVQAKKSWFFSDDRILCLGSGISCNEARYPTQTTLCQKSLRNNEQGEIRPTSVDGAN